jgi:hypothetical protein
MTFVDLHFLQLLNISTKMISPFQICQQRFPDHISSFCQASFHHFIEVDFPHSKFPNNHSATIFLHFPKNDFCAGVGWGGGGERQGRISGLPQGKFSVMCVTCKAFSATDCHSGPSDKACTPCLWGLLSVLTAREY